MAGRTRKPQNEEDVLALIQRARAAHGYLDPLPGVLRRWSAAYEAGQREPITSMLVAGFLGTTQDRIKEWQRAASGGAWLPMVDMERLGDPSAADPILWPTPAQEALQERIAAAERALEFACAELAAVRENAHIQRALAELRG